MKTVGNFSCFASQQLLALQVNWCFVNYMCSLTLDWTALETFGELKRYPSNNASVKAAT